MSGSKLTQQQIDSLTADLKQRAENIKPHISRKRYFSIEEKINSSLQRLGQILDWQEGRQNQLSKYSFILDTHYFEQEFLN